MNLYYPEMGEKAPAETKIHAQLSHYGEHYFLRVAPGIELKGRGVKFLGISTAESLVPGSRFIGWSNYKVTEAAFQKIQSQHATAMECLL